MDMALFQFAARLILRQTVRVSVGEAYANMFHLVTFPTSVFYLQHGPRLDGPNVSFEAKSCPRIETPRAHRAWSPVTSRRVFVGAVAGGSSSSSGGRIITQTPNIIPDSHSVSIR